MIHAFTAREVEKARVLRTALDMLGYTLVTHGETLNDLAPMLARAQKEDEHISLTMRLPDMQWLVVQFSYAAIALAALNGAMTTTDVLTDVMTGAIRMAVLGPKEPTGDAS